MFIKHSSIEHQIDVINKTVFWQQQKKKITFRFLR